MADAHGLFVQREIDEDDISLVSTSKLHTRLVHETARRMASRDAG
ncbi:hypothetical protein [Streptomyces sp. H72]